ncbi:unnamed protein product [Oppiella nova]|uniref:Uncharacterized protein n=1 Tax=Oppiella nova TaxID=334625 RepID=A0A7R9MGL2_9ACAR|nr:unnamed protein product [Oppiella nova]CAG2176856.1 unnamed protein product [Oppiella nova]
MEFSRTWTDIIWTGTITRLKQEVSRDQPPEIRINFWGRDLYFNPGLTIAWTDRQSDSRPSIGDDNGIH